MVEAVRKACRGRHRRLSPRRRPRAAVLVALVGEAEGLRLLLTRRAAGLAQHQGEMGLPGGRLEGADRDAWACCLREAEEEVGLDPASVVRLGRLDDRLSSSGYLVHPWVGWVEGRPRLAAGPEVARIHLVEAAPLLEPGAWEAVEVWDGTGLRPVPFLARGRLPVWGLTGSILLELARRLAGGPAASEPPAPYRRRPGRPLAERAPELARRLVAWYRPRGRDLPWRRTRDPYRVWLSEVMLQQTRVETVLPYYTRFLERFPTVEALAAAPEEAVLAAWEGLGYYRRARNLQAAAREVAAAGTWPASAAAWARLPGVGRSTAGAIAAICLGEAAPVLDGNVKRVLSRLLALRLPPADPRAQRLLWSTAAHLTPRRDPATYTQAIMELGATCCTPRRPACDACPWADACGARALELAEALPARGRRPPLPRHHEAAVVLHRRGRLLLERRPEGGMLAGLWCFPHARLAPEEPPEAAARRLARRLAPGSEERLAPLLTLDHAYTHFRLRLHCFAAEAKGRAEPPGGGEWVAVEALEERPMAATDRRIARAWADGPERRRGAGGAVR